MKQVLGTIGVVGAPLWSGYHLNENAWNSGKNSNGKVHPGGILTFHSLVLTIFLLLPN